MSRAAPGVVVYLCGFFDLSAVLPPPLDNDGASKCCAGAGGLTRAGRPGVCDRIQLAAK